MKATGMVRRIDELGRVVLPKEIRRTLRIKEGDPLEIYMDKEELILKKYSPLQTLETIGALMAEVIAENTETLCIIFDSDSILSASGEFKKEFIGEKISPELEALYRERKSLMVEKLSGGTVLQLTKGSQREIFTEYFVPIITSGDCIGIMGLVSFDKNIRVGKTEITLLKVATEFLSKQFE